MRQQNEFDIRKAALRMALQLEGDRDSIKLYLTAFADQVELMLKGLDTEAETVRSDGNIVRLIRPDQG